MMFSKLREGQRRAVDKAIESDRCQLAVQLPTGYGKSATAVAIHVALREAGRINRTLILVPTTSQRDQFCKDARHEFARIGASLNGDVYDVGYGTSQAWRIHRDGTGELFVCTIQALTAGTLKFLQELMATGKWMIVIDEHHHYACDKSWGRNVAGLKKEFLLAMSATAARRDNRDAFDEPDVTITYRAAFEETAVKELALHAYEYRVDAITVNGETVSFNTSELVEQAGSDSPEAIERFLADRKMRWSPKYIAPMISIAMDRLETARIKTGMPLQMIVHAMCVSHAQLVCEQIRSINAYNLRIDWVGTGPNGRTDDENKRIVNLFCPPKRGDGKRHPEDVKLDILVSVGIAGEGLDAVYVTESILLNKAGWNNSTLQKIGRGARRIPGVEDEDFQLNTVIVDSSSPLAAYSGDRIMDVYDADDPSKKPEPDSGDPRGPNEYDPLPEEPKIVLVDCTLESIDIGDPQVREFGRVLAERHRVDPDELFSHLNNNADRLQNFFDYYRAYHTQNAEKLNGMAELAQRRSAVDGACGKLAHLLARRLNGSGIDGAVIGRFKTRINEQKKRLTGYGVPDADVETLKRHYALIREWEQQLMRGERLTWL